MWKIITKNIFKRQYKQLSSELQGKVKSAINELTILDNPLSVGIYKPSLRAFAYEVGRSYRIIYNVHFNEGTIELIRVGDHKQTYGKD